MSTDHSLPVSLLKANLELNLRVARLVQENSQRWLELARHSTDEGVAETTAELEGLLKAEGWQNLANLPSQAIWRQFQQRLGDVRTASQLALNAQTEFNSGLQQAIQAWQKTATEALGETGTEPAAFNDLFKQWGALWAPAAQAEPRKKAAGGHRS